MKGQNAKSTPLQSVPENALVLEFLEDGGGGNKSEKPQKTLRFKGTLPQTDNFEKNQPTWHTNQKNRTPQKRVAKKNKKAHCLETTVKVARNRPWTGF